MINSIVFLNDVLFNLDDFKSAVAATSYFLQTTTYRTEKEAIRVIKIWLPITVLFQLTACQLIIHAVR